MRKKRTLNEIPTISRKAEIDLVFQKKYAKKA